METSLHQQLKAVYAESEMQTEVRVGRYRVDAINNDELIEIQHGSLSAIRSKVSKLLRDHRVRVVKPLIARKLLVKCAGKGKHVIGRRRSPKKGRLSDVFDELIYFRDIFPHPNLSLEVPLVEVEEWRYPYSGRRRRHRGGHAVEDQKLLAIVSVHVFSRPSDLVALVPQDIPAPFHTGQLAAAMDVPRWVAQRIAYCLRHMQAIQQVGKDRNSLLYERCACDLAPFPSGKGLG